ncbi:DUF1328 domain-containing protein [Uliginosibacterium sp. H1]|uniref:DUF1328 domain-containing protein n=1 Tax=Uliginosibacterium sp. H1 TaxID=3114757 RepID=UPI002E17C23F|nr:DUF1328 domain-containing protein [Uliginosibacterium sp. H1]
MLDYTLTFLALAVVAGLFGFGGVAAGAESVSQILFVIFLLLALISFVVDHLQGRPRTDSKNDPQPQ